MNQVWLIESRVKYCDGSDVEQFSSVCHVASDRLKAIEWIQSPDGQEEYQSSLTETLEDFVFMIYPVNINEPLDMLDVELYDHDGKEKKYE